MTFEEALVEIGTHRFSAYVNVASDFRTFLRAAREHEAVQAILQQLDSEDRRNELFLLVTRLSRRQVDARHENPWDSALAILVWLLSLANDELVVVAARAVLEAPRCWWAKRMGQEILQMRQMRTEAISVHSEVTFPDTKPTIVSTANPTDEVLLDGWTWTLGGEIDRIGRFYTLLATGSSFVLRRAIPFQSPPGLDGLIMLSENTGTVPYQRTFP